MTSRPPTLAEDLYISESDDGVVVYQESTERVHHLNDTAGAILALCDGTRSAAEIAAALADNFGLPEPPVAETEACLTTLAAEGVVVSDAG